MHCFPPIAVFHRSKQILKATTSKQKESIFFFQSNYLKGKELHLPKNVELPKTNNSDKESNCKYKEVPSYIYVGMKN